MPTKVGRPDRADSAAAWARVIAVSGDKVWVRDVQTGADHLGFVSRCRKLQREPLAFAAE